MFTFRHISVLFHRKLCRPRLEVSWHPLLHVSVLVGAFEAHLQTLTIKRTVPTRDRCGISSDELPLVGSECVGPRGKNASSITRQAIGVQL